MKPFVARALFRFAFAAISLAVISQTIAAEPRTVIDAAGRKIEIADASRIASVGGSVTEVLYALGLGDRVIAVDQTSTYPEAAREKKNLGYMRALSAEGVLATSPSLILAIEGSGPPDAIEILQRASVPFVLVPDARDQAGVAKKIRFIAEAAGAREEGEKLSRAVLDDFSVLAAEREKIKEHRKAVFVLAMGQGSPIVGGRETSAEAIFKLAGVDNALDKISGFKPAVDEMVLASAPDAVVVMSDRDHALNADTVFALPAFAGTPAARTRSLVALPGLYLLGFGPRTAHAAHDLAAALYPELKLPSLPARPWTKDARP
jgi:iron complex transport system substrate-binding protein